MPSIFPTQRARIDLRSMAFWVLPPLLWCLGVVQTRLKFSMKLSTQRLHSVFWLPETFYSPESRAQQIKPKRCPVGVAPTRQSRQRRISRTSPFWHLELMWQGDCEFECREVLFSSVDAEECATMATVISQHHECYNLGRSKTISSCTCSCDTSAAAGTPTSLLVSCVILIIPLGGLLKPLQNVGHQRSCEAVYTRSALVEQTTPDSAALDDIASTVQARCLGSEW